jgi:hypothetical protein
MNDALYSDGRKKRAKIAHWRIFFKHVVKKPFSVEENAETATPLQKFSTFC